MSSSITVKKVIIPLCLVLAQATTVSAQQPLTQIYTDYQGFWTSSTNAISPLKPDTSHMLLAFEYSGITYSTGVADATLARNNVSFQPADFQAFDLVNGPIDTASETVIGVGNRYGGNGNVTPVPVDDNLQQYLSDGIHGLDLGTAIFNTPAYNLAYPVYNLNPASIGDSIPDIIVTQVGEPPVSSRLDTFRFVDAAGNVVGHTIAVSVSGISIVGTGYWKFYDPGVPPTYNAGLLGDRQFRLLGFDLADFGITPANAASITGFLHKESGMSDQAFTAYNAASFTPGGGTPLAITLTTFQAIAAGSTAALTWTIAGASHFAHFGVERAGSNGAFTAIATVAFQKDNGATAYTYLDKTATAGTNYYRLKLVNEDGTFTYSAARTVTINAGTQVTVYPNPATNWLYVQSAGSAASATLTDVQGKQVAAITITGKDAVKTLNVSALPQGTYILKVVSGDAVTVKQITVQH